MARWCTASPAGQHHPFGEIGVREYQKQIAKELGFKLSDVQSVDWGALCPPVEKRADLLLELKREGTAGVVTDSEILEELEAEDQATCLWRIN